MDDHGSHQSQGPLLAGVDGEAVRSSHCQQVQNGILCRDTLLREKCPFFVDFSSCHPRAVIADPWSNAGKTPEDCRNQFRTSTVPSIKAIKKQPHHMVQNSNNVFSDGPRVSIRVSSELDTRPPDVNTNDFTVRQVVVHEDFAVASDGTPGHSNLALLRLSQPLKLDRKQAWPICLPPPTSDDKDEENGNAIKVELVRAQQGDGSMADARRQEEEEKIDEYECNYRSAKVGREVGDCEDVAKCKHKGSFATGFEGRTKRSLSC